MQRIDLNESVLDDIDMELDDDNPYGLNLTNKIPTDPITAQLVTELSDAILFQDGQIYSSKALKEYFIYKESKEEELISPWTKQKVIPTLVSPENTALKNFIAAINELKGKCEKIINSNVTLLNEMKPEFINKLKGDNTTLRQDVANLEKKLGKMLSDSIKSNSLLSPEMQEMEIDEEKMAWITELELKKEIPVDVISLEPITEVKDPILFQDGQFYSYKTIKEILELEYLKKHKRTSPYTREEIKPVIANTKSFAMNDLIASFHELRKIYATLLKQDDVIKRQHATKISPLKPLFDEKEQLLNIKLKLEQELLEIAKEQEKQEQLKKIELQKKRQEEYLKKLKPRQNKFWFKDGILHKKTDDKNADDKKADDKKADDKKPDSKTLALLSSVHDIASACQAQQIATGKPLQLTSKLLNTLEFMGNNDFFRKDSYESIESLGAIFEKKEIPIGLLNSLLGLSEYQLNFIIDDSGSMNILGPELVSRWQELRERMHEMIDILAFIPVNIQISFLNREDTIRLHNQNNKPVDFQKKAHDEINKIFKQSPMGLTPLYRKLRNDLDQKEHTMHYLFTDGEPSDCTIQQIKNLLMQRRNPKMNLITLINCSNKNNEWIEEVESNAPLISSVEDYASEKKEIQSIQGKSFPYSRGIWLLNQLCGVIDPFLDAMNEQALFKKEKLDDFMGRIITKEEYNLYLKNHPQSKMKKSSFGLFSNSESTESTSSSLFNLRI